MNESIYIILNQFKKEHITEEEAAKLIEDLYISKYTYIPTFPSWPQVTYESVPKFQKFEVTCKNE